MKILLTNDDGIYAEGIRTLARTMASRGKHQLSVCAPDRERSAAGHSITIHDPLRAERVALGDGLWGYKINGTPADCVKLGLEKFVESRPDLIISGINNGYNLGYDVLYSGTVSAAMEGFMMDCFSLAVSLGEGKTRNYQMAAEFIADFIEELDLEKKMLLNINIPNLSKDKIQGTAATYLGKSQYEDGFEERFDPMGNCYYWMTGSNCDEEITDGSDIYATNHRQISVTPLKLDLTDFQQLESLKKLL